MWAHWNTVLLLWYLSTKCNADYLQGESRQAVVVSVVSNGSFTYFTTCIEGGAGRVNDSVALHDGNVGLDNLQLRNTTTTNDRQTTVVETVSDQDKQGEGAGQKWAGHKTVEEKKKEKWAHSVLAEESVVSCRAAELARFTNTWRFGAFANKTHTPPKGRFLADLLPVHLLWLFVWALLFYDHSPGHRSHSQAAGGNVHILLLQNWHLHVIQWVIIARLIQQPSERRVTWSRTSRNLQDEGSNRITAQGSFD